MAVIVPIVSKKSVISNVKTSNAAVKKPAVLNPPNRSNEPINEKSGLKSTNLLGIAGTFKPQPLGLNLPSPKNEGPIFNADSRITAITVAVRTPIKIAPFVWRAYKNAIKSKPTMKTTTGHPTRVPPAPSSTGTGPD